MTTDAEALAGILLATTEDAMPRVIMTFEVDGRTVSIVEPVMGSEDGVRRGKLWHAVVGDFVLSPTRRSDLNPDRWVPGCARLLPESDAELLAFSTVSPAAAATGARRILRKRASAR